MLDVAKGEAELTKAASLLREAGTHDLNERIAEVSGILSNLQFETNDRLPRKIGDLLPDYMDVLEKRMKGAESGLYLKTGIEPMDNEYGDSIALT